MKITTLIKEVLKYEWCDVLMDRFYSNEYSELPVSDIKQEYARNITFKWGFITALGINALIFIFVVFRYVENTVALAIIALLFLALSLLGGALFAAVYLFISMRIYYKELEKEKNKNGNFRERHNIK